MAISDWLVNSKSTSKIYQALAEFSNTPKGEEVQTVAALATVAGYPDIQEGEEASSVAIVATVARTPNTPKGEEAQTVAATNKTPNSKNTEINNSNISQFDSKSLATVAILATVEMIPTGENTKSKKIEKHSYFYKDNSFKDNNSNLSNNIAIGETKKPTIVYITQRMEELGLTKEDVRGENDPPLALDEEELNDIRNDKALFDIWVEHVHRYKQLKALELVQKKREERYTLKDTLGSLLFEHKFKFIEHVLIAFKKFFFSEHYKNQKPNELFVEIWFLANEDLTLDKIFDASVRLIRLARDAKDNSNDVEFKRLWRLSEDAEGFRQFCLKNY